MRFLDHVDREAIPQLLASDEYFWLDLDQPGEEEERFLADTFRFHPLALEDMRNRGQRPKLEDYGEYMFLVYYGARDGGAGDAEAELQEVHAFLSGGYIVTSHAGSIAALDAVRRRLEAQPPRSEQFVVYRVLDALTDSFFPVLERLDDELEGLDEQIFDEPSPAHLERITELRRQLVELRRVTTPQRDLLARGTDEILEIPGLEADSREYFRDLYDHAIRISEQIDAFRDLLSGSRDAYLSTVSNRLNQITTQLTVVATIFLPLSFLVGFFGQNFAWLIRNIGSTADFFVLGLGSLVLSVVVLLAWFRRSSYV
ncbi:MAG: magnesium transporter CorA family protein [Actinobacteria bacterium]|nr:magnesium transporter CorA family protein [Actinomycetota bacterium]